MSNRRSASELDVAVAAPRHALRSVAACAAVAGATALSLAAGPSPGSLGVATVGLMAQGATATVIGNQVFGDSYLVTDGAKTYAVLDVYVKSVNNTQNDRMGSIYGVATSTAGTWIAMWQLQEKVGAGSASNSTRQFKHAGNSAWRPNYTGGADAGTVDMPDGVTYNLYNHAWDSFVTSGLRYQSNDGGGTTALQMTPTSFSNFGTANAGTIGSNTTGTNGGAGWYSLAGSTAGTNPFCQFGYYNGQTGAVNTAKATSSIAGNGITAGQSLDNHYMVARVTLDMADMVAGTTYTLSCKFAMTVITDGQTKAGSTDTNFRVNQSLTFVPGPGAIAAVSLAAFLRRRRTA